ncbi:hypothetical protein VOLCADRAFT_105194 [Volvox carteri f. nagariensis]|uniref:Ankyrin repeat domain-containing protein n=1 Tax=Volvox carteri f. nagariensis TaxID=3068 RepID=D8TZ70_VOLCA|nr:uncharacterized protein VOLCADRAFT_105194 [Volvox carteri f. nagariensis]EFJ47129.1 hypothetical protein VOLCADRAFT_105194 [Volvox carteri f. nagariensis]|eukprot:XP_002951678.1 hypothetical protein VOLCADRAFT_105194 [Volvox carteri f. nagariensis]
MEAAAASKHPQWREKIEWLLEIGAPWCSLTLLEAAREGHLEVLKLLMHYGIAPIPLCYFAAVTAGGDRMAAISEWLEAQGVPVPGSSGGEPADTGVLLRALGDPAALPGRLSALRWLVDYRRCRLVLSEQLACAAAEGGDVAVLSYILEPRVGREHPAAADWPTPAVLAAALLAAANAGQYDMVRHLVEVHNAPLSANVAAAVAQAATTCKQHNGAAARQHGDSAAAAAAGSCAAALLRWLHCKGCPADGSAIWNALRQDDLAAADVAYDMALAGPFRAEGLVATARWCSLAAMQWMVAHGSPLGGMGIMAEAAETGDLEKVKWLHAQRCDWDSRVFTAAAANGHGALLTWLAENHCPMGHDGDAYVAAVSHFEGPDWSTLGLLKELGCPWGEGTLARAAEECMSRPVMVELMKWMMAAGCPYDHEIVPHLAAIYGRPDLDRLHSTTAAVRTSHSPLAQQLTSFWKIF